MDDKLLKTFLAVADHCSFTAAAKELYLAQSAVSKHIHQLEKELQVHLFVRDTRMVRLTDAGTRFYREATDLLERMENAAAALRQDAVPLPDKLHFGAFSALSTEITDLLRRFCQDFPQISVTLDWFEFGTLVPTLVHGKLDGAFTVSFELLDQPRLASQKLEDGALFVLVGKQSPLAGRTTLRLADLAGATYYTMRPDVSPNGYAIILNYFLEHHFRPSETRRLTSHESVLLQLQIDPNGYGLMSDFQFRQHPGVVFIPLEQEEQPSSHLFDLVAAWDRQLVTPALSSFLNWLANYAPPG